MFEASLKKEQQDTEVISEQLNKTSVRLLEKEKELNLEIVAKNKLANDLSLKEEDRRKAQEAADKLKSELQATIENNFEVTKLKDSQIKNLEELSAKRANRVSALEEREKVLVSKLTFSLTLLISILT